MPRPRLFSLAALLSLPPLASAATLPAPDAYGSIQAVIDVSSPGDIIDIGGGDHDEALVIPHDLTLLGDAVFRTELDLSPGTAVGVEAAIHVEPGVALTIDRLDLKAGATRGLYGEAGATITLLDVGIRDSGSTDGGGAWVDGDVIATDLLVENTSATTSGGGLWVSGDLSCTDCRFVRTTAGVFGGAIHHGTGTLQLTDVEYVATSSSGPGGGVFTMASDSQLVRNRGCGLDSFLFASGEGGGTIRASGVQTTGGMGVAIIVFPGASWLIDHSTFTGNSYALISYDARYIPPPTDTGTTGHTGGFMVDTAVSPGALTITNSLFVGNQSVLFPFYGDPLLPPPLFDHNAYDVPLDPLVDGGPNSLFDVDVQFVADPDLVGDLCPIEAFLPTFEAPTIDAGFGMDADGSPADIGASGGPDTWATFHADNDADGFTVAKECDDTSAASYPLAEEVCDGIDNDCNGEVDTDTAVIPTWFPDADGDGYGDGRSAVGTGQTQCLAPEPVDDGTGTLVGWAPEGSDCDDTDPLLNPGVPEDCDGATDLNCDGSVDFGAADATTWWPDLDQDEHGDATAPPVLSCTRPGPTFVANSNDDCNDAVGSIHPGTDDICNGLDDNCSGDESDALNITTWYPDADGDGFPNGFLGVPACIAPTAHVPERPDSAFDCDDDEALSFPGNTEVCDGIDNNCSGTADDLTGTPASWYPDDDGDGFGSADPRAAITSECPGAGYVDSNSDCNDADASVRPDAAEVCNGVDDDCTGTADDGPSATWYVDGDGDGWGGDAIETSCPSPGLVEQGGDCQDGFADIHPGADEVPGNDIDEDCVDGAENPASTSSGEPAAAGCQCSSSTSGGGAAWLGAFALALARLRRRSAVAAVGLAACGAEPVASGLPEVQLTFPSLDEATAAAPWFAVDEPAGPALLQRQSRVTFLRERPGVLELHHRAHGQGTVTATLALQGIGRDDLHPVPNAAAPEAVGNRIVLDRGPVVEWYLNGPDGIEQGFTLGERAAGVGPLRVAMAVDGLEVRPSGDDALVFVDAHGLARFRYDHLVVIDRDGASVPAALASDCQEPETRCQFELVVDDSKAAYPLYVDPLLAEFVTDVQAVDAVDQLGSAVAVDGDRAIVSAPSGIDGRVFILERNEGNPDAWGIEQTLFDDTDGFGEVVAFDDPYLAVGAPDSNTVKVFVRDAGWTELQTLTGTGRYGEALELQVPYLLIGAPDDGDGTVTLALLRATGQFDANPLPQTAGPNARFGASVALRLPNLVVGAPELNGGQGAVLVFDGEGIEIQRLQGAPGEQLGSSLQVSSARMAIGVPAAEQVRLYDLDPNAAGQFVAAAEPTIDAPAVSESGFGTAIALLNDTLIVGDRGATAFAHHYALSDGSGWMHTQSTPVATDNDGGAVSVAANSRTIVAGVPGAGAKGEAAIYARSTDTVITEAVLQLDDGTQTNMGRAVAVDGDLAAVGDETALTTYGGRVDLYVHRPGGWSLDDTFVPTTGIGSSGEFGHGIAIDGDIVVAGAPGFGQAFVYTRQALGWTEEFLEDPDTDPANTRFGEAVAIDGPLIAVGDPSQGGRVQIYELSAGLAGNVDETIDGDPGAKFGTSVAVAGDTIAVGAPGCDSAGGIVDAGCVEIHRVTLYADNIELVQRIEGSDPDDRCGISVAFDADRLAIGCPNNGVALLPGKALLYRGDLTTFTEEAVRTGSVQGNNFGSAVAIDDDRWFVAAKGASKVRMYQRNTGGEDQWGEERVFDGPNGSNFGSAMDVDGNTVIIGSPNDGSTGAARIFRLDATIPPTLFDDAFTVDEDAIDVPLTISANDISARIDPIVPSDAVTTNGPGQGTLVKDGDDLLFTPDPDVFGVQTFEYTVPGALAPATVTIDVLPVNDLPVAVDDAYTATEEVLLTASSVLANDSDVESPVLTASLITGPTQAASFALASDGTFTYEGTTNFFGTDTFTYEALDGEGASSGPATVVITVLDAPEAPILTDSAWTTELDTPLAVAAPGLAGAAYAQLPGTDTFFSAADTSALDGVVQVLGNGGFTFVPDLGFVGTTSFVVQADNEGAVGTATVSIEVVDTNRPPEPQPDAYTVQEDQVLDVSIHGVLANDVDPDGDDLQALFGAPSVGTFTRTDPDGTFTWTPPADFHGDASFTYTAGDGSESAGPVLVTLTVEPVNDMPVALDDEYEVEGPGPHVFDVGDGLQVNDSDPDGDDLTAVLVRSPSDGTVEIDPDGGFTFTPRIGLDGEQVFAYLVSDGLATARAEVVVTVTDNALPTDTSDTGPSPTDTGTDCDELFFPDQDGDGFADAASEGRTACQAPPGFAERVGDCDDTRADRYPGAPEIQGDGIDQDCDGVDADIAPAGACSTGPATGATTGALLLLLGTLARRRRPTAANTEVPPC